MSKSYNNITDISTTNLYRMLEMDRYQDKDSQTMIKAELAFRNSKLDWHQNDNINAFNKMTNIWRGR